MTKAWKADKHWSDRFIPLIKPILGSYLIGEAPMAEDQEHNTDLIVLRMEPLRIACRVRRASYLASYGNEFTIRSNRPNGAKTEWDKLMEGWGDYFFYGFADKEETTLAKWTLGDLRVFRFWIWQWKIGHDGALPCEDIPNDDGSSSFKPFKIAELPEEFVVGRSR